MVIIYKKHHKTINLKEETRLVTKEDLKSLKEVLDSIELFPSEYLDDIISNYLNNPETQQIWFTCSINNTPISIGYCAPEKFTNGTYNLLAIGVKKEHQSQGIGQKMMHFIEQLLKEKGNRILLVETSSHDKYQQARNFYTKLGYSHEATIKEFWDAGEDKIIFWKKLN